MPRRGLLVAAAALSTAVLAGCGSATPSSHTASTTPPKAKPSQIIAGPAGILGGTVPQLSGQLWILAGTPNAKTLHPLNLVGGKIGTAVPVSTAADAVVESGSGLLALGLATSTTGAVQFRNGSTAAPVATVALGAPVSALTVGADATTFYALNGNNSSMSVSIIDSLSDKVTSTIPVPLDTVSIAVDPNQQRLFALEQDGQVDIIAIAGNQVLSHFFVGDNPKQLLLSPDGSTMYVLKGTGGVQNIGVIDAAVQRQTEALPAPGNTVSLQVATDSSSLYAFVGTSSSGNVQVLPLSSVH